MYESITLVMMGADGEPDVRQRRAVLERARSAQQARKLADVAEFTAAADFAELYQEPAIGCQEPADSSIEPADSSEESIDPWEESIRLKQAALLPSPTTENYVDMAGDGCPRIAEFAHLEWAARLGMRPESAFSLLAEALAVRHRLPGIARLVASMRMPVWVAKQLAGITTALTADQARGLSLRLAVEATRMSPHRLLAFTKAAVLELTAPTFADEHDRALAGRQVRVEQSEHVAHVTASLSKPHGLMLNSSLARLAGILQRNGDTDSLEVRRSKALGLLATPARALQLLQADAARQPVELPPPPSGLACDLVGQTGHTCGTITVDPDRLLPRAQVTVHLPLEALSTESAPGQNSVVARVNATLGGAQLAEVVGAWLAHSRVTVRPVLDTAAVAPVSAYEVPRRMREVIELRNPNSVFPHSTRPSIRLDLDHTIPFHSGWPDQTQLSNLGPLTRREHRAKTHGGWRLRQPSSGRFEWRSPLGYEYLVDDTGTYAQPEPPSPHDSPAEKAVAKALRR